MNGQPALERKPSSGPIFLSRSSCSASAVSNVRPAGDLPKLKPQFPGQSNGIFTKVQDLRYGENSHQQAALYRDLHPAPGSLVTDAGQHPGVDQPFTPQRHLHPQLCLQLGRYRFCRHRD